MPKNKRQTYYRYREALQRIAAYDAQAREIAAKGDSCITLAVDLCGIAVLALNAPPKPEPSPESELICGAEPSPRP